MNICPAAGGAYRPNQSYFHNLGDRVIREEESFRGLAQDMRPMWVREQEREASRIREKARVIEKARIVELMLAKTKAAEEGKLGQLAAKWGCSITQKR